MKNILFFVSSCFLLLGLASPVDSFEGKRVKPKVKGRTQSCRAATPSKNITPDQYKNYVGKYTLSVGTVIEILVEKKRLFTISKGYPKSEIFPISATEFNCPDAGVKYHFDLDSKGCAYEMTLFYGAFKIHGTRES